MSMGKRKRMLQRAAPARLRHHDLMAELAQHNVHTIYDLPYDVHLKHRAIRLMGVACP